ncbi:hypothetical protein KKD20_01540, partial [Patescibacteria group bacterium]|nr:hypothetical protein [Patescibacteria group bacterium]
MQKKNHKKFKLFASDLLKSEGRQLKKQEAAGKSSTVLYLATYPPRECGIATFTRDLTSAMDRKFSPALEAKILAINDNGSSIYNYSKKVQFQIN